MWHVVGTGAYVSRYVTLDVYHRKGVYERFMGYAVKDLSEAGVYCRVVEEKGKYTGRPLLRLEVP